jgi:hypothetical protein
MKIEWFPILDSSVVFEISDECPIGNKRLNFFNFNLEKWFVLAINLYHDGTTKKISVDLRIALNDDWESTIYESGSTSIDFGEEGDLYLGSGFSGLINSLQIKVHSGKLSFNREDSIRNLKIQTFYLDCHEDCAQTLCIGVSEANDRCTQCYQSLLDSSFTNKNIGICVLGILNRGHIQFNLNFRSFFNNI